MPEEYATTVDTDLIAYDVDYNIMDEIDITGLSPNQVIILDMEYNVRYWKDVLKEICMQLYELDSELFESFTRHKDFEGRENRTIANINDGMNDSFKLADNIYIETTFNANTTLSYCRLLLEKYDLQDDVFFRLRR